MTSLLHRDKPIRLFSQETQDYYMHNDGHAGRWQLALNRYRLAFDFCELAILQAAESPCIQACWKVDASAYVGYDCSDLTQVDT
jgi:hypothetical protein